MLPWRDRKVKVSRKRTSLHQRGRESPSLHQRKHVFSEPHHPIKAPQTNLHTCGGDKECVKRVIAETLTHALAKNINMQGINGKIGFQHLQIK
ncbi:hypothetical protein ATANTOWER_030915 [Ataeniobius toweri]|uniref:Uncharacterized protein n=1 Tax=Ataeniobius toweri TaxID=208326 RepID=A0ABU7B0Q4_9TELE|nr:hypothetical protein [Ataeniobius toweri]